MSQSQVKLNPPMSSKNMIYICSDCLTATKGGGDRTYVQSLLHHRPAGISEQVLVSIKDIDQSQFGLLHIQQPAMLWDWRQECPAVYTMHAHGFYCPSGTKYLAARGTGCDRPMSYLGCTWGHLVDGCGSRRPQNIVHNLQDAYREQEVLKKLRIPVIANSDYVRGQLIKHSFPAEQVVTLRYGIPMPETVTEPLEFETHQNHRLLFVGRIIPQKGLDWLLKALTQVERPVHLDIAGEGWAQPQMERLAQQLGVSNRVMWHGWCSRQKLDELYQQCYALVFPSLWHEPAGLVTLEAYAHYRPVIASSSGGIPEHVRDGETGIVVPANDIKKLASAITELTEDYQKARRMGEQGHTWFLEKFTMDIHVQQLQKIYEKAITDFNSRENW